MGTKIPAKQVRYGLIRQNPASAAATAFMAIGNTANQWTNPGLAATNYRTVLYTKGVPIQDPGVTISDMGLTSQKGLNAEVSNFYIDGRSGLAKLNFSCPVDKNTLTPHLIGALQAVSENATTPFAKTITNGFIAGTIDFNGGGGYLHSIAIDKKASADDGAILENAVIDNLTLTFDFMQKGIARCTQMSGTWVGNEMNFEQTLSGTWVETTMAPIFDTDYLQLTTFTVDSVDWSAQCIRRMVLTINNNVTSNCATANGKPNQYDFAPDYVWTIVLDHNATTEKLMGDFQAGAAVDINFTNDLAYAAGGADCSLTIDTPYCRVIAPPETYNGDYAGYSIQCRAFQSSTTTPISILWLDTLDWGY